MIKIFHPIYGIPVTYLGNYCPNQFEIFGLATGNTNKSFPELEYLCGHIPNFPKDKGGCGVINGNPVYARLIIRKIMIKIKQITGWKINSFIKTKDGFSITSQSLIGIDENDKRVEINYGKSFYYIPTQEDLIASEEVFNKIFNKLWK